jgi:hypothetical protein
MHRNQIARFPRFTFGCLCVILAAGCSAEDKPHAPTYATTQRATVPHDYAKWEKEIAALQAKPAPPKGGFEFTGSSNIVRWKSLNADFPGQPVFNRGFGGSMICDVTYYADRIIFPYEPKMIFLRSGGNDLHGGKSVEEVFADFQELVKTVHAKLPDTTVVYISLSPAPARWGERDAGKMLNGLVKKYANSHKNVAYVETYDLTITPDGQPRDDLFVADKLHFNDKGFRLMADRVRPLMPK